VDRVVDDVHCLVAPDGQRLAQTFAGLGGPDGEEDDPEATPFSANWAACSTAYSSSSDRRPSTPARSTVRSGANFQVAVGSGTYLTRTTIFMRDDLP